MSRSYIAVMTNDKFYPGLCALVHSLKKVQAKCPLSVVIPRDIPAETKQLIADVGVQMIEMDPVVVPDELLSLNSANRWNATLFKLNIFNLTQFEKIVFLDLDMIVLKNIDELFDAPHMSAVVAGKCVYRDWTRLNSGILVVEPDKKVYEDLLACCDKACEDRLNKGFGFGDQDVINYLYPDWYEHQELVLPEIYNALSVCIQKLSSIYAYENLKVAHFADPIKPWKYSCKDYCIFMTKGILKGEWVRLKAFLLYRKYLKQSCPNYSKY